jgi:hypothetical protein
MDRRHYGHRLADRAGVHHQRRRPALVMVVEFGVIVSMACSTRLSRRSGSAPQAIGAHALGVVDHPVTTASVTILWASWPP